MPSPAYVSFNPDPLLEAAKQAGHLTDAAIAEHAGVTKGQICRIRKGDRGPNLSTFWLLIDAYGLNPRESITYTTDRRLTRPRRRRSGRLTSGGNATPARIGAVA